MDSIEVIQNIIFENSNKFNNDEYLKVMDALKKLNLLVQPLAEPTVQPSAEPTVQPSAEPTVQPSAEPTVQSVTKPTVQQVAEPTDTSGCTVNPSYTYVPYGRRRSGERYSNKRSRERYRNKSIKRSGRLY
jgi:hypothetical protein